MTRSNWRWPSESAELLSALENRSCKTEDRAQQLGRQGHWHRPAPAPQEALKATCVSFHERCWVLWLLIDRHEEAQCPPDKGRMSGQRTDRRDCPVCRGGSMPESERQWASRQICVLWHVVCIKVPPDSASSHVCFTSITVTSKGVWDRVQALKGSLWISVPEDGWRLVLLQEALVSIHTRREVMPFTRVLRFMGAGLLARNPLQALSSL